MASSAHASVDDGHARLIALADGRRVGVRCYGDPQGVPVLALHGAPACGIMYALADAEARRHGLRLIAPDRPGYSLTPADEAPTLSSRTDWHVAIADALDLDRFAILAISGGGPYAVSLASRVGPRATALALVSPMGPVADYVSSPEACAAKIPLLQRRFFLHLPKRFFFPALGRFAVGIYTSGTRGVLGNIPRLIGDPDAGILDKPGVREVMAAMTREAFRTGAGGGIADMTVFAQPWRLDYSTITAPAMLWQGTSDRIVPVAAALYLARLIPGCRLVRLDGEGHFWVFDHVETVCAALRRMLDAGSTLRV